MNGGGRAIYTDWTRNNTYANQLGVNWSGNANDSSMTVTDPALAAGLGGAVSLYNPGWGVFSMGMSSGASAAHFTTSLETAIAYGTGNRVIVNGFLTDTFVNAAQGQQLYLNEINALNAVVPEPSTFLAGLGALGMLGMFGWRNRE